MALFVTRAVLEVNGSSITQFKSFSEKAIVANKAVPLMYSTGGAELTKRYQLEVEYVYPRDTTPFDFLTVTGNGATLSVEYDSGERHDWGNVRTLEVGDAKVDGENELVKAITLMAESKDGNRG